MSSEHLGYESSTSHPYFYKSPRWIKCATEMRTTAPVPWINGLCVYLSINASEAVRGKHQVPELRFHMFEQEEICLQTLQCLLHWQMVTHFKHIPSDNNPCPSSHQHTKLPEIMYRSEIREPTYLILEIWSHPIAVNYRWVRYNLQINYNHLFCWHICILPCFLVLSSGVAHLELYWLHLQ